MTVPRYAGHIFNPGQISMKTPGQISVKINSTVSSSDETIKNDILNTLARQHWAPKAGLRIDVKASIVNLEGVIYSDSERRAVNVIAENAPGVKHVNDHLVFVDAGSGMAFPGMM